MALDERARLAAEAGRVRASGDLGRSDVLDRLFAFLLDRSLEGRVPKEAEVAHEVFGKRADFDAMQDASVRVYIHRLRRKLEEHYAGAATGDRLTVPRGEYRLALARDEEAEPPPIDSAGALDAPGPSARHGARAWIALALLAAINIAGWAASIALRPALPGAAAAAAAFWRPLAGTRPTFVVAGDYYIFGEAPDAMQVTRLVREFAINSQADLDQYIMAHPEVDGRYFDVDLHYLPTSAGAAMRAVLPVVLAATGGAAPRPDFMAMSQLTPDRVKTDNIVYVGFLSGLGLLRNPLFEASGFEIGASYDELIDRRTGRHFASDWGNVTEGRASRRDYGYIASMPGPTGNRILIVAGTRDAAVMQAAEMATDPAQLKRLDAAAGGTGSFEALYEVGTLGNLNLSSTLVVARPLRKVDVWQPDKPVDQAFPDEAPHTVGPGAVR